VLRIVILLQTGVPYNAHQLAQETGVHRRTIFRDIASLRGLGLPVQFDADTARYYLVQDALIGAQAISTDELTELLLAASLAMCTGDTVRRTTEKLALRLPPERRKRILALNSSLQSESPASHPDPEVMEQILTALHQAKPLSIFWEAEGHPTLEQIVYPRRIVFTADECWLAVTTLESPVEEEIRIADIRRAIIREDGPVIGEAPVPPASAILPQDHVV
jgi:predicted DNA-binding transcriptional regulator YafY